MKDGKRITKYFEWIAVAALLIGLMYVSTQSSLIGNLKPETGVQKIISMTGTFVMIFLALAAHEAGHLMEGLRSGFRFELYVVGPFGFKREGDRVKMYFNRDMAYFGGVAATLPKDDNPKNAKVFARILLAGPIASLLFAVTCFVLAFAAGKPFGIVSYVGGIISLGLFFATTIPSRTGMFFTDRKRYQRLTRPGKDQEVELALLKIMGRYAKYGSYRNIDKSDIEILIDDELPFFQYYGLFNLICLQLENEGIAEEQVEKDYALLSENMSKNVVLSFDKEIALQKEKFQKSIG
ncbi:MAG: M50 family metallopeptidase [Cryomorphaceae bacterium]